jgi:predicted amidohydrolase
MIQVAICQCGSVGSPEENQETMENLFLEAVKGNPNLDLVVFPEYCYYTPEDRADSLRVAIDLEKPHPFVDRMKELAKEYHVNLIPGSFAERVSEDKVCNSVLTINRNGEIIGKYRKIHLFDAANYKESSYVEPGDSMCIVDTDFGKMGVMVCYDLRFPELARSMCLQGADFIVCPAEFPSGQPLPTRVDDWDILVRSTALTNLTYVVTANQFGLVHKDAPFGRSCVVDPRGVVVSAAQGRNCVVFGSLDLEYQRQTRKNLAVWENRKPDMYTL